MRALAVTNYYGQPMMCTAPPHSIHKYSSSSLRDNYLHSGSSLSLIYHQYATGIVVLSHSELNIRCWSKRTKSGVLSGEIDEQSSKTDFAILTFL